MDLEYINIIQESCEEMADIFDYDNNYTLARPYLQEAEEQKEGLIKRGIGAIIRFVQKIYGWFKEKIELVIDTIRKKLFNNNKVVAAAAEKQLEKEEAKAPSQPTAPKQPTAKPAQPTVKAEPKQSKPAVPVKQLSEKRKAIFDIIRSIIKGLRSGDKGMINGAYYAQDYKDEFSEEEKSMSTYDFTWNEWSAGKEKSGFHLLSILVDDAANIEQKVLDIIKGQEILNRNLSKPKTEEDKKSKKNMLNMLMKDIFNKGTDKILNNPLQKIERDCFDVFNDTSFLCYRKNTLLDKLKPSGDLNKLSHMLNKSLKQNKMHEKDFLKQAHEMLLQAFQLKQVVLNKVTIILNIAVEQVTISARKVLGLLFQLSRKA